MFCVQALEVVYLHWRFH